jgi:uncharacterized membrane protein
MLQSWLQNQTGGATDVGDFTFQFGLPLGVTLAFALLTLLAVVAAIFWWSRLSALPGARRAVVAALRAAALLLVLFLLCDPLLVGHRLESNDDYVILLFDDSRSMRIAGEDGVSRAQRLQDAYTAARETFESKLRARHQLAVYRFGETIDRVQDPAALDFDERESNPAGAIDAAIRDLVGANVSAVVLFSDGVRQGVASSSPAAAPSSVPVYTVGVDTASVWRDLEIRSVGVARTNFDKSPLSLTVQVAAQGLAGRNAVIEVFEGDRLADAHPLAIGGDTLETKVALQFLPRTRGWLDCTARVRLVDEPPAAAAAPQTERVLENNARGFVVDNRERAYRILYFSGRPNWQNKFIRRALEDDPELKLAGLIRISGPENTFDFRPNANFNPLYEGFDESEVHVPRFDEAVFVRLGLGESELADGYPLAAEDLFPFDLVIWGDIEANYFSSHQFEITRDYVSKRGGSLLLMGGARGFTEGHYEGTLIEPMLPVMLHASEDLDQGGRQIPYRVTPTVEGFLSGVWSLDTDPETNEWLWTGLPEIFGVNRFPLVRAGATESARAAGPGDDRDRRLFVAQRYGAGVCAVLATGETWQWHLQMDPADTVHDRFWRQMIRSLVQNVPPPVVMRSPADEPTAGDETRIDFLVRDALFDKREGMRTAVRVTPPMRPPVDLPVEESIAESAVYTAAFAPAAPGPHRLTLTAKNDAGETVAELETALHVQPDLREYRNAAFAPDFLRAVADESGGAFYTLDRLAELADTIPRTAGDDSRRIVIHLWNFPGFFILIALLFSIEWYLRRRYGQP